MKVKNLPKRIYLQIGEDCDHADWDKIYPSHEVSWCEDKINDNDIVYSLDKRRLSNPSKDTGGLVGEMIEYHKEHAQEPFLTLELFPKLKAKDLKALNLFLEKEKIKHNKWIKFLEKLSNKTG